MPIKTTPKTVKTRQQQPDADTVAVAITLYAV
jgi:hypothetical protein